MTYNLRGMDALQAYLGNMANFDDVREVVKLNGAELEKSMKRNAKFKGHYKNGVFIRPTGATRRSITLTINGLTARVTPTTEYASYLEYGTRFMAAQPFVRPSFEVQKQKFIDDLLRLMSR